MKTFTPSSGGGGSNNSGSIKHLWFDLGIERCHEFIMYKMYKKCADLVTELHESLQSDGNDNKSQSFVPVPFVLCALSFLHAKSQQNVNIMFIYILCI